jgi:histidinol-phosphate aminotransferase
MIKEKRISQLHLNELPFGPAKVAAEQVAHTMQHVNRYPEHNSITLRSALAEHLGVDANWVVVGNGSIGVIQQAMMASGQREIAFGWPGFEAFEVVANVLRMPIHKIELRDNACDLAQFLAAIRPQTSTIIVCSPNSPTGGLVVHQLFEEFMRKVPSHVTVIIDEAYKEFVEDKDNVDGLALVRSYANVVCTRTFSKAYGLAGLRLGYGIAQPALAQRIAGFGLPFQIPVPTQEMAIAALRDQATMRRHVQAIIAERARMAALLRGFGATVFEGHGNFIWLPLGSQTESIAHALREYGVFTKSVMPYGLRITVGTEDETNALGAAWKHLFSK